MLSNFKYNAMSFVNGWSSFAGLTVESQRRRFRSKFDVRGIASLDIFNEIYREFLDNIMTGLLVKTETLNQGKLALVLSQVLTLASSTSSFIVSNISSDGNVDSIKDGAWEYLEDKIVRFNRAKGRAKGGAEECLVQEEVGGGIACYW